jgi:hypothetical protein
MSIGVSAAKLTEGVHDSGIKTERRDGILFVPGKQQRCSSPRKRPRMTNNRPEQQLGMNELCEQQELLTDLTSNVAVLVCSSDSRRDVLERALPSLFKYWPDCPYPIYVGLNSDHDLGPKISTLVARPSEWRVECLEQIAKMSEQYLILVLDDFLFQAPVNQNELSTLVAAAVHSNLAYLRLVPLGRSIFERLFELTRTPPLVDIRVIKENRPFYSSLQIAIWNRNHLSSLLGVPGSIWNFEHNRMHDVTHYAITCGPPILYSHLVEKGRWLPYAKPLLRQAGLPADLGTRPVWSRWMNLRLLLDKLRFLVLGYANH